MLISLALLAAVLFLLGRPIEQGEPFTRKEVRRGAAK
jgi:hypothetical protein